ncbi:hypothetical protein FOZ62_007490 [Perkinsus olseni]|uniref:Reverse transcriptase domain-containing protein n=1 Tax=Perkinsus olseni TaxID=32597 RepID=A0A7J6T9A3_PEROL|nr:hypothetical protein FOZ62_007490 [Perkinsus olseni]
MVTTTFDVSSAFDKISFGHIIDEVVAITENPAWGCLLNSYLHGHQIFLDNRHTFRTAGVAQGGVLAPICFAAATWRMGDRLQALTGPYRIRVAIYADDICAKIIANGILGLSQGLKDAVSVIKPWTDRADLHLDPSKNETITDSEITSALLKDHLEDTDIHYIAENTKPCIKWLGLWLTPHNNWRTHIDYAFGKGKRALSMLRRLLVKDWDFSPKLALLAWKTHVIPTLLYGSEIWGGTASRKWYIEKCTKLEAVFARKLFGLPRSAPTDLASRMLATVCEPIWVQARLRFACYKLHKVGSTQAPLSDNTRKILEGWGVDSIDDRETLCTPVDGISVSPPTGVVFNVENGEPPNPPKRSTLCFYSDGSVMLHMDTKANPSTPAPTPTSHNAS